MPQLHALVGGRGVAPSPVTNAGLPAGTVGRALVVALAAVTLLTLIAPAHASAAERRRPGDGDWGARQARRTVVPKRDRELVDRLPGRARLGYHPATGRVRAISGTRARPLERAAGVAATKQRLSSAGARTAARGFMRDYGRLFGLARPGSELVVKSTRRRTVTAAGVDTTAAGPGSRSTRSVRFSQRRDGVPVMGGEIIVRLSDAGDVLSARGEVLPSGARAPATATIALGEARSTAAKWLAREARRPASAVMTRSEALALYDPRIMGGPSLRGGTRLVWRISARLPGTGEHRVDERLVLVDARGGQVITAIGRIADGVDRRVCDLRNRRRSDFRCQSPFTRREGQAAVGIADVDAAYRLMGVVDGWFRSRFGRDGIDGKGSRMKASVRFCPVSGCPWRNAEWHWSHQQAVFGAGWARADDVVAHEFVHGVLDHEARLFYHYQSGAINEAFADIFGELIDLDHPGGLDTNATKWKIGEDTPIGVFRDMKDPTRRGHPDRVRSPLWHTNPTDFGGVHRNNGVANKAAYLMATGADFRGYDIAPIGRERTARIFYEAMTEHLTSAADYVDLGDALTDSCAILAGSSGITLAHCKTVRDVVLATQMHRRPAKKAPLDAPVCGKGKSPVDVFHDDLEDPRSGNWKRGRIVGKRRGWFYPPNPNDNPIWDGTWASSGELNLYAPDRGRRSDTVMKLTRNIVLPKGAFLHFQHGFSFDSTGSKRYDGGLVEIKLDGRKWRSVKKRFTHGSYNGRIIRGTRNPLAGRRAYTADSRGYGSARVDLSGLAGRRMKLRFRMGSDRAVGGFGWYIDDVRVYVCAADDDKPTGSLLIDDGAEDTPDRAVSLAITASDATTWVTRLRVSNSAALDADGRLKKAIVMPIRDALEWDLNDAAWGGVPGSGSRAVYAQVRDAAGNWSDVFEDDIELLP